MTTTELVPYDRAFATAMLRTMPVFHRQVDQAFLLVDADPEHDVDWRFYDPARLDLDLLEGLEYWDQVRARHPERVQWPEFLDGYRLDHLAETGNEPKAQWYRTARQNLSHRRLMSKRHQAWNAAARSFAGPDVYFTDHEAGTLSGTETFSSYRVAESKAGLGEGPVVRYDSHGQVVEADGLVLDRETIARYVDRSVSEAKIFNPGLDDGFTLIELLEDMERFVKPVLPDQPEPDPVPIDPRYGKRDLARRRIDPMRELIEFEELRASAIEICKFKWNDDLADKSPKMARGRIWESKLLDWGLDKWSVVVTRRRVQRRKAGRRVELNRYTVFVRTHVGSETKERDGVKKTYWTWEPQYWRHFTTQDQALDWGTRLVDGFSREQVADLDYARWPQNLANDRILGESQARKHSANWQRWDQEGWTVNDLDDAPLPGQIPFDPGQHNTWDPLMLAELIDGEAPVPEPAE